jgi:hypothetical protein
LEIIYRREFSVRVMLDGGPALKRVWELYHAAGFDRRDIAITVDWSRQLTSSAGNCKRLKARGRLGLRFKIKLSSPIMAGIEDEGERDTAIYETLIHEFAHAFAYQRYGDNSHGSRAFRSVLRAVGRTDLAGTHSYDSVRKQKGGWKFHRGMIVEYDLGGATVVARVLSCSSRRANVFRPGLSMLVPYRDLTPAQGVEVPSLQNPGKMVRAVPDVPWPRELLDMGEKVGYGHEGQWYSGVIVNFGPTRARIRLNGSGDERLIPYGWIT